MKNGFAVTPLTKKMKVCSNSSTLKYTQNQTGKKIPSCRIHKRPDILRLTANLTVASPGIYRQRVSESYSIELCNKAIHTTQTHLKA